MPVLVVVGERFFLSRIFLGTKGRMFYAVSTKRTTMYFVKSYEYKKNLHHEFYENWEYRSVLLNKKCVHQKCRKR